MSAPRIVVAGATTAITRRTSFRKAFLAPWHPAVAQIWLYSLAYAQSKTGVAVHLGQLVLNHQHLDVTPSRDNLPEFTHRLVSDTSKGLNALLKRERYDAPGSVFDSRQPHHMRLLDAEAQVGHLVYEYTNCVAAGLVDRPEHMPGHVFDFQAWKRGYIEVSRPDVFFDPKTRPDRLRLEVTPPPLLYAAFDGDLGRLIYHLERLAAENVRSLRTARRAPAAGARAVRRVHPWSEPRRTREASGRVVPSFKIGARGPARKGQHVRAALEVRGFRAAHRRARALERSGEDNVRFPFGTYGARVQRAAAVEKTVPEAWVTAPGPTLEQVQAELASSGRDPATDEDIIRLRLPDRMRAAFAEQAASVCDEELLDLSAVAADQGPGPGAADDKPDRIKAQRGSPIAGTARGTDAGLPDGSTPRRIVVLRDHRRGRPCRPRHAADPPA